MTEEKAMLEGRWSRLQFPLCALHIFSLCSLALANPLFEVTAKDAAFYVVRGSKPIDILSLIGVLCILVPLLLILLEGVFRVLGRRAHLLVHFLLVGALSAVYAARLVKVVPGLPDQLALAAVAAAGIAAALLYARTEAFRRLVSLASPVIIVFPLLFVFGSQVGEIVKPGGFVWSSDNGKTSHVYLKNKPPIVFVLMDELPVVSLLDAAGNIDAKRFPNLAQFAGNAHWFKNATAVSAQTTNAVPAILTGIRPNTKLLPNLADHPNNLFTFLGENYNFNAFESVTYLCPTGLAGADHRERPYTERMELLLSDLSVLFLHIVTPVQLTSYLPSINNKWGDFAAKEKAAAKALAGDGQAFSTQTGLDRHIMERLGQDRTEVFRKMVANIKGDGARNTLHFVHVMLPHSPKEYLPSGKKYTLTAEVQGVSIEEDKFVGPQGLVNQFAQRHILQTAYLDRLLGDLMGKLKKERIYEDALIVLVADHGAGYTAGDFNRRVSSRNLADLMFVPLLIKLPGQKNGVVSQIDAETTDLLPSLADVLGVKLPWKPTGISLFSSGYQPRTQKVILTEEGTARVIAYATLLAMKEKSRAMYSNVFALSDPASTPYWFGKYRHLLGRRVTELNQVKGEFHLTVEQTKLFEDVQLKGDFVPASISGIVVSKPDALTRPTVAIAVNGVVQAVAESYSVKGGDRFSTIVPEEAFVQGKNEVRYYLVAMDRDGKEALLSADTQFETFALEKEEIVVGSNRRIPIVSGAVAGVLDHFQVRGRTAEVSGWAANVEEERPAHTVVLFAAGKFLGECRLLEERPDIAQLFRNRKVLRSGFYTAMPADLFKERRKIRAFAIANGVASELHYHKRLHLQTDYLSRLSRETGRYALEQDAIVYPGGEKIAITPGKIEGSVDSLARQHGKITISGWCADRGKGKAVDDILIFERDRIVAKGKSNVYRKDVAQLLKKNELRHAGFEFVIPSELVKDPEEIRLFAVSQGSASELTSPRAALLNLTEYRLEAGRLVTGQGEKVPVIAHAVQGELETVTRRGKSTLVSGWAADVTKGSPVESLVVFAGNRPLGSAVTHLARPDVSKSFGNAGLSSSGFNLALATSAVADPAMLRIFAISKGVASELSSRFRTRAQELREAEAAAAPAYLLKGDVLVSPKGETITISPDQMRGSLDGVTKTPDGVTVSGWGANIAKKEPADCIVIFHDGKFLDARAPNSARPDVGKAFDMPTLELSGYEFHLPVKSGLMKLRIFAVLGGLAAELPYSGTLPEEKGDPAPGANPESFSNSSTAKSTALQQKR